MLNLESDRNADVIATLWSELVALYRTDAYPPEYRRGARMMFNKASGEPHRAVLRRLRETLADDRSARARLSEDGRSTAHTLAGRAVQA